MALTPKFPAPTGRSLSSVENGRDLAALVMRDANGVARAGVTPRSAAALVTSQSSSPLSVSVAAFEAVVVRNGIPGLIANDGAATVLIGSAPSSNSRYHVVYAKQNESASPFSDGSNEPVFGFVTGAAAASPDLAAAIALVPAGGLPLAAILVPTGVTTTQAAGVVISQIAPMTTTTGGVIPIRALADVAGAWLPGTRAALIGTGVEYEYLANDGVRASVAGWFRREGSVTSRTRNAVQNINNGTNTTPIDYNVAEITPETPDFTYSNGVFTARRAGTFRVTVLFAVGVQGAAVGFLSSLRKNGTVIAESVNLSSTIGSVAAPLTSDIAVVPGDTITVTSFANIAAPGIGTDSNPARNRIQLTWLGA